MRNLVSASLAIVVLVSCAATSAEVSDATAPTIVPNRPPAPRIEVRPASPGDDFVWAAGYWRWEGDDYAWVAGSWVEKPERDSTWVPGHWSRANGGWEWIAGHWQRPAQA